MQDASEIEFAGCRREHIELAADLIGCISEIVASGQMLQGEAVERLEASLSERCGRRQAVCVGSGTDALFFALTAIGIGPGDEVLLPDLSFIATAGAICRTGATPVLADVDAGCNLNLDNLASRITPRTRALVYVQLFGGMGDAEQLEAFGTAHGLSVVEDAAQSFGARLRGRSAGGVGRASALSFDPMKVLSALGSGGAVLTDDPGIAARVRRLRYHGREAGQYVELGYNSQMPSLTAAALSMKLEHHDRWTSRRQAIAARYLESFVDLPLAFPEWPEGLHHVWHKFTLRTGDREALAAWLRDRRVPTMVHYPRPFHREPVLGCQAADTQFPEASQHAASTLSLPIHAHLTAQEVERIADAVRGFFGRKAE
jgi:dTDP-4-amino-4,6-dideoxygalactose transaminase